MSIYEGCRPRPEVLEADLQDSVFAASFGDVVAGRAHRVYQDAATFFANTFPTRRLKEVVGSVFRRLANPNEAGAVVRLSTGFGGGKTHCLIVLWHLAHRLDDLTPDVVKLLPGAGRPHHVRVVGIDAARAGSEVFDRHGDVAVRSLQGEIAWQLHGREGLARLGELDHPLKQVDEALLDELLPAEPLLILLDELVIYLSQLPELGQNCILALINRLASIASRRAQMVLVVTDPADQRVYSKQSMQVEQALVDDAKAAIRLDELLSRRATDADPIGTEAAQVITTRLFEWIDPQEAERVSAQYHALYQRVLQEHPGILDERVATPDYARRIRECYPFHPRLMETAEGRLAALPDFQRSRGVLRLFARMVRDLWERQEPVDLITAGEVNWASPYLREDLIHRINRHQFEAVARADIDGHAAELDGNARGIHTRVASALLLESLAMDAHSGLSLSDLTLAVLRPEEAGHEPREAMERLAGVCWHTYPFGAGAGWQFRVEPNVNRMIEERVASVLTEDARSRAMAYVQERYQGSLFQLVAWPRQPSDVPDSARLQLVLCESVSLAEEVCRLADDGSAPLPRRFINSICALAPSPERLNEAILRARRLIAAERIQQEYRQQAQERTTREQLERILPTLRRQFQVASVRAFDRVVLASGEVGRVEEAYQVPEEGIAQFNGQQALKEFLRSKGLLYERTESLDPVRLVQLLSGATPLVDQPDVYTARAVHERLLSAPDLRLIPDEAFVRNTLLRALKDGKIVLRTAADGAAYDSEGMVKGGERRAGVSPYSLPVDDTVWVTPADSAAASVWLAVKQPEVSEPVVIAPPGGSVESAIPEAFTVEEAIQNLSVRRLEYITIRAHRLEQEQNLLRAVQELSPRRIKMSVTVSGRSEDGAIVNFAAAEVPSLQHATRPHEVARRLCRALVGDVHYQIEVLLWVDEPAEHLQHRLERLRDYLADGMEFVARFSQEEAG